MAEALPYGELWRKMAAEATGTEDDLGPLTDKTRALFQKEFETIRRELGVTFADMLAREPEVGRSRIHDAINTAVSWKLWLRQPLTQMEMAFQGVYALYIEVNNGGFHQFFFNSAGKYWPQILWAMQEAGDRAAEERFTDVLSIFPDAKPAISRTERWKQLEAMERWPWRKIKSRAHFERHSRRFHDSPFPDRELYWRLVRQRMPDVTVTWP